MIGKKLTSLPLNSTPSVASLLYLSDSGDYKVDRDGVISWLDISGNAGELTGDTLAANVVNSSLTSLGTLTGLSVSGLSTWGDDSTFSYGTGSAAAHISALGLGTLATLDDAPAGTLTGDTLAANILYSSLTSVGTLSSLTVSGTLTANHIHGNLAGSLYSHARASEEIYKGDPVYVVGYQPGENLPIVARAMANDPLKMPAIGIATADIAINTSGHVTISGSITDLATDTYLVNDTLYVGQTGGLTNTEPTGLAQPVAIVERSQNVNGTILVSIDGIGASDATVNTFVRRNSTGATSLNGLSLVDGGILSIDTVNFSYGAGSASAHKTALGLGTAANSNTGDFLPSNFTGNTNIVLLGNLSGLTVSGISNLANTNWGSNAAFSYGNSTASANHRTALGLGTLATGNSVSAETLVGTYLAPSVTGSSLTYLGNLSGLSVSGISNLANTNWGSNAAFSYGNSTASANHRTALGLGTLATGNSVSVETLVGTYLAPSVTGSSLTYLGNLSGLSVSGISNLANTNWGSNAAFSYGNSTASANHRTALGLGTLATGSSVSAQTLVGTYLAPSVTGSSLTYLGNLSGLSVSGISNLANTNWGSNAAFSYGNSTASANHRTALGLGTLATGNSVSAETLVGTYLAPSVTGSSLTYLGNLSGLSVSGISNLANTNWGSNAAFSYGNSTASANHRTALGLGTLATGSSVSAQTLVGTYLAPGVTGSSLISAAGGLFGSGAYAAAFDPASPGAIGGTTPSTIRATNFTSTSGLNSFGNTNWQSGSVFNFIGTSKENFQSALTLGAFDDVTHKGVILTGAITISTTGVTPIFAYAAGADAIHRTALGLGTLATGSPGGTANSTTYLRGDYTWATVAGGPGVSDPTPLISTFFY